MTTSKLTSQYAYSKAVTHYPQWTGEFQGSYMDNRDELINNMPDWANYIIVKNPNGLLTFDQIKGN